MTNARFLSTIIGSDKGGVGKSTIAELLANAFDRNNVRLQIVEIDRQRKLSAALGQQRINLSMDPTPKFGTPESLEQYFNPVFKHWSLASSLTDLGANVTSPILNWIEHFDLDDFAQEVGISFRFAACTTPDDQAINSALEAYKSAKRALGKNANYFVILNHTDSNSSYEPFKKNVDLVELNRLAEENELRLLKLPYCRSSLFRMCSSEQISLFKLIDKYKKSTASELAKELDMEPLLLFQNLKLLLKWLTETQNAIAPLLDFNKSFHQNEARLRATALNV
ncbi:nucleotide-binding protein [Flexibacterium corallicola]|uniref:nucleotide-binding protein n=1 Tax=Flexibacterium corallicola TaxID=3037259 RepID=UPI00286F892E|nr:hypothetical protein [Pseudovibrio sp. M1P-2-3]